MNHFRGSRVCSLIAASVTVLFFLTPLGVEAQPVAKVARIGYLSVASAAGDKIWVAAFRQGLKERGYVEGKNVVIETRHAAQNLERLPALAAELIGLKIDVAVVYGGPALVAIQSAHPSLPIVMTVNADPLGTGLVTSLSRPGGQLTGLMDGHADMAPKRLELLKTAVPAASRVAAVLNPTTPHARRQLEHIQSAAPTLGLTLLVFEVKGPADINDAFAAAAKAGADAVFIIPDPSWTAGQHAGLREAALKHRLPAIGTTREFAEEGLLMSYGTDFAELWRLSAIYVDKILKGANPGDLPIEQASKWDLVINLKTAKALGLTIPPSVLRLANRVIE